MGYISLIMVALGLSADCFAVALGSSTAGAGYSRLQIIRVAVVFGFFQALMALIGWGLGRTVVDFITNFTHWIAFGLLVLIGAKMLREAFSREESEKTHDISRGWILFTLAVATSLDALAVGLAFSFDGVNIWLAISLIGSFTSVVTGIGFLAGRKVGQIFGKRAELLGGLILIGIGVRILLEQLF